MLNERAFAQPPLKPLLDQAITALCAAFPDRLLACYLTGSAVTGTMVAGSDLDLIVIFHGNCTPAEAAHCRALAETIRSPWPLDFEPASAAVLRQQGATGLKTTAVFLYGDDIRDQIPLEPLAVFRRDVAEGFVAYLCELYKTAVLPPPPLAHPQPAAPFLGYAPVDTRLLLKTMLLGATLRVLLATEIRCGSKADAVVQYRRHIGGPWAGWLETLHQQCKMAWAYQIPADPTEQQQLRDLLRLAPQFVNEILPQIYTDEY